MEMPHPNETKKGKPIRISIRYCDESELTIEERARMDAARKRLDAQVSALLGKMIMEQQTRRQSWIS